MFKLLPFIINNPFINDDDIVLTLNSNYSISNYSFISFNKFIDEFVVRDVKKVSYGYEVIGRVIASDVSDFEDCLKRLVPGSIMDDKKNK
jgi:hypothetical protein